MSNSTEYLPQKNIYVEKLRDIHTSNCSQICEEVYEVIYKTDSGNAQHLYFGFIYITIWIHILQFGYIYYNLDINMETRHIYISFRHFDPV